MRKLCRWVISCVLVVGMIGCPAFAMSFPDVDNSAAYADAVEYLSDIGLMVGDNNGNFNPDKAVTRAEMAALVCRMLGETEDLSTSSDFFDVPESHWANGYITRVAELGIVNGYGDGTFGPSDSVIYEQAVTMIVRAMNLEEYALSAGGYPLSV